MWLLDFWKICDFQPNTVPLFLATLDYLHYPFAFEFYLAKIPSWFVFSMEVISILLQLLKRLRLFQSTQTRHKYLCLSLLLVNTKAIWHWLPYIPDWEISFKA
jgi:hypothetical protein